MSESDATGPAPLHGAALVGVAVMLAASTFLSAFDLSVANVAAPHIAAGLAVSPRDGTWAITSYMVAEALIVPLTGWLAARFGPGRTLAYAMASFAITSAMCGLSTSLGMLVAFRALQGLAGGPMIPLSLSMLMTVFPKDKINLGMWVWSMVSILAPITGPVIGGEICERWNWTWVFLSSVPPAAICAAFIWGTLKDRDPPPVRNPVDVTGLSLMVVWIVAIQMILDLGQELDWFGSSLIVALTIVAAIGFAAFLIWELTEEHPIVNLRVFHSRGFSASIFVACIGFGTYLATVILTPLWLQTNMGYSPSWAGFIAVPSGLMVFFLSPLVAWLNSRVDSRLMISAALLAFGGIMIWRAQFASNVTLEMIMAYQLMNGVCVAFYFTPNTTLAMGFLKPHEVADGAGLMAFARTLSIAFASSSATAYWQDSAARDRAAMIDRLHGTGVVDQLGKTGFAASQALRYLDGIVQDQAVMFATNDTFLIFAGAMTLGGLCIWLVPRVRATNVPAAH